MNLLTRIAKNNAGACVTMGNSTLVEHQRLREAAFWPQKQKPMC